MVEEGFTNLAVLEVGRVFEYRIPSFHVISVTLREAKFQCEEAETVIFDGFIRSCDLLTSVSLPAIARVPKGAKGACFIKKEELERSIDVSQSKLYKEEVLVLWEWSWVEVDSSEETESGSESEVPVEDLTSDESISVTHDEIPEITHSVIFKCIGVLKEHRYQETLATAARKLREGEAVPVRLTKEPHNPVDAHAIAFECKLDSTWERIGYVVREALEATHEAIDNGDVIQVRFDWVKYIVQFQSRGFYAGIKMTRRGEWPRHVLRCRSKSFVN